MLCYEAMEKGWEVRFNVEVKPRAGDRVRWTLWTSNRMVGRKVFMLRGDERNDRSYGAPRHFWWNDSTLVLILISKAWHFYLHRGIQWTLKIRVDACALRLVAKHNILYGNQNVSSQICGAGETRQENDISNNIWHV